MFWVVRSVPNDTRDTGLLYNFTSGRLDSGKLNAAVRFVIFGQGFSSPPEIIIRLKYYTQKLDLAEKTVMAHFSVFFTLKVFR